MKGKFNFGDPIVEFSIQNKPIEFLLDTGFNGQIVLSKGLIGELKLKQIGFSDYTTASGENKLTKVYLAVIDFFGNQKECIVLPTDGDFSLVGMELLHGCKIVLERHREFLEVTKTS